MNTISRKPTLALLSALTVVLAAGCASRTDMHPDGAMQGMYDGDKCMSADGRMQGMYDSGRMQCMFAIQLNGSNEVPPVNTAATASGTITVSADKSVRGNIVTRGIDALSAHIHEGAAGTNGPVIVALARTTDNAWVVPAGAMLTDGQYASYQSGNLYVNVHSAAYPNGEIRAQLHPR